MSMKWVCFPNHSLHQHIASEKPRESPTNSTVTPAYISVGLHPDDL
jgi:hypothetical protein